MTGLGVWGHPMSSTHRATCPTAWPQLRNRACPLLPLAADLSMPRRCARVQLSIAGGRSASMPLSCSCALTNRLCSCMHSACYCPQLVNPAIGIVSRLCRLIPEGVQPKARARPEGIALPCMQSQKSEQGHGATVCPIPTAWGPTRQRRELELPAAVGASEASPRFISLTL